jgi:hypothetical protein
MGFTFPIYSINPHPKSLLPNGLFIGQFFY